MLQCDKCGSSIMEGAKFCPQCGDPVTEADVVKEAVRASNVAQVEISFGYSSSANYDAAVEICKKIDTYTTEGEDKNIVHKITLPITDVELLINLFDLVGSWKSSKMLINGQRATKSALTYKGVGCYQERQRAYKPDQYCFGEREYEFNIWGCKRLGMPLLGYQTWLEYGQFDSEGKWVFDKGRIRHELEQRIHEFELCPVLKPAQIIETLEKIPDSINPDKDPNWKYIIEYKEIDGRWKTVATGVKPVIKVARGFVLGDYQPAWDISAEADHSQTAENLAEIAKINRDEDDTYEYREQAKERVKEILERKPQQSSAQHSKKKGGKNQGCMVILYIFIALMVLGFIGSIMK